MEQDTSTVNSKYNTLEHKTPITSHSSPSTFIVTLLSVLLLISVFIAGFFAYQTQRLVAELRMKNEELITKTQTTTRTSTPSTIPSETSAATSSATPILTTGICTADAKICPDGSGVGRTGPKCEFAPCPTQKP